MTGLFVTATGTGIGKTFVTAMLAHQAKVMGRTIRVLKPVTSGFNERDPTGSDPLVLLDAVGIKPDHDTIAQVSPWRFAEPIASHMAAARENRDIPFGKVVDLCREALLGPENVKLIEGIGGVMAPVDSSHTVLDWIAALRVPTLLVAGTYVGTISHTLSALGVLRAVGVKVPGLVLCETPDSIVPAAEQAEAIARFAAGVPIYIVPHQTGERPWASSPCPKLCAAVLGRG
jgi:dethiobiotin synthetase